MSDEGNFASANIISDGPYFFKIETLANLTHEFETKAIKKLFQLISLQSFGGFTFHRIHVVVQSLSALAETDEAN